jgi:hypothetical protein
MLIVYLICCAVNAGLGFLLLFLANLEQNVDEIDPITYGDVAVLLFIIILGFFGTGLIAFAIIGSILQHLFDKVDWDKPFF